MLRSLTIPAGLGLLLLVLAETLRPGLVVGYLPLYPLLGLFLVVFAWQTVRGGFEVSRTESLLAAVLVGAILVVLTV